MLAKSVLRQISAKRCIWLETYYTWHKNNPVTQNLGTKVSKSFQGGVSKRHVYQYTSHMKQDQVRRVKDFSKDHFRYSRLLCVCRTYRTYRKWDIRGWRLFWVSFSSTCLISVNNLMTKVDRVAGIKDCKTYFLAFASFSKPPKTSLMSVKWSRLTFLNSWKWEV